jgi:hypothetical protein
VLDRTDRVPRAETIWTIVCLVIAFGGLCGVWIFSRMWWVNVFMTAFVVIMGWGSLTALRRRRVSNR